MFQIQGIDLTDPPLINNIVFKASDPSQVWIEKTTSKIGDWRAIFRSSYIGWSLSINGLFAAREKYSNPDWSRHNSFEVRSMRLEEGVPRQVPIASWSGDHTASVYTSVAPMLIAHGVLDMFGAMEEFVFDFYRIYLNYNPAPLLRGNDYRELRRLHKKWTDDPASTADWENRWAERLEAWQRKKIYDGLDKRVVAR